MIEVPYNELIPNNYYYITKGSPNHANKHFGKFLTTDVKPNGDAWVYFSDIERLFKNNTPMGPFSAFILTYNSINRNDPEWHFYKELAQPKERSIYETVLTNVLKDPNAIKEYLSMMKETRSKTGSKKDSKKDAEKPSKTGGKRTKKHRKTYKKHK
jgi:hypothetical protein